MVARKLEEVKMAGRLSLKWYLYSQTMLLFTSCVCGHCCGQCVLKLLMLPLLDIALFREGAVLECFALSNSK